jgi:hypothetical protein
MTTGRSVLKYSRVYVSGYDLSGYARSIGPLACTFQEGADDPINASVIGTWMGQATITPGTLNALFDNTATTGLHALMGSPPAKRDIMVAQGIQAIPAAGDPVFVGQFPQDDYITDPAATPNTATMKFGASHGASTTLAYYQPWGVLAHAYGAETTDNVAAGIDELAATSDGGYMMYQVFTAVGAGSITATIKVQDASINSDVNFGDLLSSGVINCGAGGVAVPTSGVVALATTAAVKQYIRWQVTFGTATSVTFALAFIRNKY